MITFKEVEDIEIDGINIKDYPDFVDAYISSANFKGSGIELTDSELDSLQESDPNMVYELIMNQVF